MHCVHLRLNHILPSNSGSCFFSAMKYTYCVHTYITCTCLLNHPVETWYILLHVLTPSRSVAVERHSHYIFLLTHCCHNPFHLIPRMSTDWLFYRRKYETCLHYTLTAVGWSLIALITKPFPNNTNLRLRNQSWLSRDTVVTVNKHPLLLFIYVITDSILTEIKYQKTTKKITCNENGSISI